MFNRKKSYNPIPEEERLKIIERTTRGRRAKAKQGTLSFKRHLFGYRLGEEGKREVLEPEARTVREMARGDSVSGDFVRPGHVHPLLAKEGGVLRRAGHTEAAVDLCRMAGLAPVGVLCEILNESGDRANREELRALAKLHGLLIISI